MSHPKADSGSSAGSIRRPGEYVVVARRYRPQCFEQLVGQKQVSQALANAITTQRIGHAYLFAGARGVGKTSTARIFAKALNCVAGPTPSPCNECDICQCVATGEDVDVLEIDGASNRGIDEIRQLRSNVNIRPSRARFKIYIIDEVHMLTTPAFNALLKTLEEPPEHVKFIFCTTDPDKIPITVLSRCQRFDFAPLETSAIVARLRHIVETEGVQADDEALHVLARRATGSMRDSQSLLEQLVSYCGERITIDDVHAMLGTARGGRLATIASGLVARDAAAVLAEVDAALAEGVDAGQLAEQLSGCFRDMMAAVVGCQAEMMLHSAAADYQDLLCAGNRMGLETILAVSQILDQAITRMRQSTHVRSLLELALVRVCMLADLDDLSSLVAELQHDHLTTRPSREASGPATAARRSASSSAPPNKEALRQKKTETTTTEAAETNVSKDVHVDLNDNSAESVWKQALSYLEDLTADYGSYYERVAISAPNRLVVSFKPGYTLQKEGCERPERKVRIEQALARVTGRTVRVHFELVPDEPAAVPAKPIPSLRQRIREKERSPLVRQAMELFDAEVTRLEEPPRAASPGESHDQ